MMEPFGQIRLLEQEFKPLWRAEGAAEQMANSVGALISRRRGAAGRGAV